MSMLEHQLRQAAAFLRDTGMHKDFQQGSSATSLTRVSPSAGFGA